MDATERALRRLKLAYGAGQVSTDTLEVRAALALAGRTDDAIWDLPRRWFRPAPPIRALVAGDRVRPGRPAEDERAVAERLSAGRCGGEGQDAQRAEEWCFEFVPTRPGRVRRAR